MSFESPTFLSCKTLSVHASLRSELMINGLTAVVLSWVAEIKKLDIPEQADPPNPENTMMKKPGFGRVFPDNPAEAAYSGDH